MKRIIIFLWLAFAIHSVQAQNLVKMGVVSISLRNSGPILQDGAVKGYYFFYNQEKKDSRNNNYLLSVYDENLREINAITITRPRTYTLVEGAFNGELFAFFFYDSKAKSTELIAYDQTLKEVASTKKVVSSRLAQASFNQIVLGTTPMQAYLIPIANKGFLCYGVKDDAKDYQYDITFYDNTLTKKWSKQSSPQARYEFAAEAFQDNTYVGSLIGKKERSTSKSIEFDLLVQEVATGRVLFQLPVSTSKFNIAFSDVYFDEAAKAFVLFGEYYNKTDKTLKDQSLGFATLVLDMKGAILLEKYNSWKEDISKVTPVNEKGKFEGLNANILFHETIRTSDGKIFVIGEQYKKAVSAGGVALQVLSVAAAAAGGGYYSGSSVGMTQLDVYNMVVFEFNADFSINKAHLFEKDKNVISMPAGAGYMSSKLMSYLAKAYGGFDYTFTQKAKDSDTFIAHYINYDRGGKGVKSKNVLGSIVYTPEKTFTVDKIELNRKSSNYSIFRAKDGYVLVVEYFQKEKRLESRLEKINY